MGGLDSAGSIQGFVDTFRLPFPNTVSEDGALWARFGILAQGEWVFVNQDGTSWIVPLDLDADHLEEQVRKLLAS
ncbi:MAG TPA: hypothetical protein VGR41_10180 [Actinomycetota bacterium]|jgi:hypothetical protein|nr:hypothetical protein [Actinomycetota bacterium]